MSHLNDVKKREQPRVKETKKQATQKERPSISIKVCFQMMIINSFGTCQVSHFKTYYTIPYHIVVTKGLEDTQEILQWYNLGAAHVINLSNVRIKRT